MTSQAPDRTPRASMHRKNTEELLSVFSQSKFDVFGAIDYMLKAPNQGVRDYLVNQLYEIDLPQVEFVLPQLCNLFMVWTAVEGESLAQFIQDTCARSLHFGLKTVWLLQAEAAYSTGERFDRCMSLLEKCEMSIVNAKVDPQVLTNRKSRESIADIILSHPQGVQPVPAGPESATQPDADEADGHSSGPTANAEDDGDESPPPQIDPERIFEVFVAKQQRSEYFNAEVQLMKTLEQISDLLVEVARAKRKIYLKEYLKTLNSFCVRGLYFPLDDVNGSHYRILNIPPSEAISLNSRDKAPYLIVVEIERTEKQCGDFDIYKSFDLEEVMTPPTGPQDHKAKHLIDDFKLDNHIDPGYFSEQSELKHKIEVVTLNLSNDTSEEHDRVWIDVDAPDDGSQHKRSEDVPSGASRHSDSASRGAQEAFGELWEKRKEKLRETSRFGSKSNWDCVSVIFKGGDDLRQECLAMQCIKFFDAIFRRAHLPLKLTTYSVLVTSPTSGIIQTVVNSHSIDSLKKDTPGFTSLAKFFELRYGGKQSPAYEAAQRNFIESMAAYSVVCFILQIKDRHNGNILLDADGHIIHIDFGFMLSNSPASNLNFEQSPFKLTREYVEVMEGEDSEAFSLFKMSVIRGFLEARQHAHKIILLVEILLQAECKMPCFLGGKDYILTSLKERLMVGMSEDQCVEHVVALIEESVDNWRSVEYDKYQRITNGIL